MKISEAFAILDLEKGSSKEDIDKAYKKGLAKNHPDKFQDEEEKKNAEQKFKDIQTAYNLVKNNPFGVTDGASFSFNFNGGQSFSTRSNPDGDPVTFADLAAMARNSFFRRRQEHQAQRANAIVVNISFAESILGCVKDIEVKDKIRCSKCSGSRVVMSDDTCADCDGKGNKGCDDCRGTGKNCDDCKCVICKGTGFKWNSCAQCGGIGVETVNKTFKAQLQPGTVHGSEIGLIGSLNNRCGVIRINVEPDSEMTRSDGGAGKDVLSEVEISLKEALQGVTKVVKSIHGEKNLKIKAGIKHNQELLIRGHGIPGIGDHIITVKVNYPQDIDKLIEFLEKE